MDRAASEKGCKWGMRFSLFSLCLSFTQSLIPDVVLTFLRLPTAATLAYYDALCADFPSFLCPRFVCGCMFAG